MSSSSTSTEIQRVLIVGCGAVVDDLHVVPLQRLARLGAVEIVGLVDPQAGRTQALRHRFPRAGTFDDLTRALGESRASLCLVTSPAGFHARHIEAALDAGCHVLVEKPMVTSTAEAQRILQRNRRQQIVGVAHPRRFFPQVGEVARLLRQGDLAATRWTFSLHEGSPYAWPIATDSAFRRASSGGGVLIDKGVHALDVLDALFGPGAVASAADDALLGGVEASSVVELEYRQAFGHARLSWEDPLCNGIHLVSSQREFRLGPDDITSYQVREPGGRWQTRRASEKWPCSLETTPALGTPLDYYQCAWFTWINFIRAIRFGEPVCVDPVIAGRVLALIESAYATARPLQPHWMPPKEQEFLQRNHWRAARTH